MHYLVHQALISAAAPTRMRLLKKIIKRQAWQQEEIRQYQQRHLQQIIQYCWKYVPFYRSRWGSFIDSPMEIQTIEDLQKLPVLSKDELREELAQLTTTATWIKSEEARTGGSTGRPTIFRMTKFDQEYMWAQMYTAWQWSRLSSRRPFFSCRR